MALGSKVREDSLASLRIAGMKETRKILIYNYKLNFRMLENSRRERRGAEYQDFVSFASQRNIVLLL